MLRSYGNSSNQLALTGTKGSFRSSTSLAIGIKDKAWQGIMRKREDNSSERIDHRIAEMECEMRQKQLISDPKKSDNLPVSIEEVPRQLYVNSEINMRKLDDIKFRMILNKFQHKNFDAFLESQEGKNYYLGISFYDKKPGDKRDASERKKGAKRGGGS